jgi:hypothetical protein
MRDLSINIALDYRKEWNNKFLNNKTIKKLNLPFGKDYYARMNGNRVVEIYSVDENEYMVREPLRALLLLPMVIPLQGGGFELYGLHYTNEDLNQDESEIIKLENS